MRVLIVSNEYDTLNRIGNPIIPRLVQALSNDRRLSAVSFCPFENKFSSFLTIRRSSKNYDLIHIQFGGIYALLIWICLIGIRKPKYLTFHGTDIHAKERLTTNSALVRFKIRLNQLSSFISIGLFDRLGFVSESLYSYIPSHIQKKYRYNFFIQPLGVDLLQLNK